ncbi:MAG: DEAD/DEAH box helicase [Bacteriovoracaceae bacterium]|nr:DEAD/DEAH box helicase [Bacteriovoracaceae bacterium]
MATAQVDLFFRLKALSQEISEGVSLKDARSELLSMLENLSEVPVPYHNIIQDLLNKVGFYPYLGKFENLDFRAVINQEFHRSEILEDYVLHREQFLVSEMLRQEKSVILSAPTSFGKSLLIEEIVASKKYKNIVIIEPTLALIDEVRNRLKKYSEYYKIIFSKNQKPENNNIFLLTQERLIEYPDLPDINFFVIDEFYKLDLDTDERSDTLNHAFYLLLKKTRNFYLLGPPIKTIPTDFLNRFDCELRLTDFETVRVNFQNAGKREAKNLFKLLDSLEEQTLIYCKGPGSSETNAKKYLEKTSKKVFNNYNQDVIEWINENLHKDWSLVTLLQYGIAFHHGGLPRHISRYLVEAFNNRKIKYLFCTTTLIEGVNTSAKNIVVYDEKKGDQLLSRFDLRNIAGRAGRMNQYLSGNVYMFVSNPTTDSDHVDIPWFTQDSASDSLLVQIDENDLTPPSRERVRPISQNTDLDFSIIKGNSNVDPSGQIKLASALRSDLSLNELLAWSQNPTYPQLKKSCELIWEFLVRKSEGQRVVDGVFSADQLTFITNIYRTKKFPSLLLQDYLIKQPNKKVDDAISTVMSWVRKWFEFRMPKMLMTLHSIQEAVYNDLDLPVGNYKYFASELEHGFLPPSISTLREMGIPAELGAKIVGKIGFKADMSIDDVIKKIKVMPLNDFSSFEKSLIQKL